MNELETNNAGKSVEAERERLGGGNDHQRSQSAGTSAGTHSCGDRQATAIAASAATGSAVPRRRQR